MNVDTSLELLWWSFTLLCDWFRKLTSLVSKLKPIATLSLTLSNFLSSFSVFYFVLFLAPVIIFISSGCFEFFGFVFSNDNNNNLLTCIVQLSI